MANRQPFIYEVVCARYRCLWSTLGSTGLELLGLAGARLAAALALSAQRRRSDCLVVQSQASALARRLEAQWAVKRSHGSVCSALEQIAAFAAAACTAAASTSATSTAATAAVSSGPASVRT